MNRFRIPVIGIGDDGPGGLGERERAMVAEARTLYGGARHLAFFAEHPARKVDLGRDLDSAVEELAAADAGDRCVVLASGDPLLYGIGATLARRLGPERLDVHPHVSSVQLAFARIGLAHHEACVLSAHGRDLRPVLAQAMAQEQFAVLLDEQNSAAAVARALLEAGMEDARVVVGERLGGAEERLTEGSLRTVASGSFDPLSVMVVLRERHEVEGYRRSAIPDDEFAHRDGLITKAEVRALDVAALRLRPTDVLWDIGAGSGSVGIEAALGLPQGAVYALDRDERQLAFVRENRVRHRTPQVEPVLGEAPEALAALPDADAVFVGGGGADLGPIIGVCALRLRPGGRLVTNVVALERLGPVLQALADWSPQVTKIDIARGKRIGSATRLEALNPVHIVAASKPEVAA